jgi:uroporphyrinogen-III synthase
MLEGKVIAITRDEESARDFVSMVEANKGKAIALPTITLVPRGSEAMLKFLDLLKTHNYDYALFMSANAVNMIFDALNSMGKIDDAISLLNNTNVVAVGPHTKEALEKRGIKVSFIPTKYSSYGVIELFSRQDSKNRRIVIPRSSASTNYLASSLSKLGMIVDELHVYDVKPSEHGKWSEFMKSLSSDKIDCMVFTSASSVNSFFEVAIKYERKERLKEILNSIKVIAIGPFTNDALLEHGLYAIVSEEHTIAGTFEVAVKLLGK